MKRFLRSRLVMTIVALIVIAAAVIVPLSGSIARSHAASSIPYNAGDVFVGVGGGFINHYDPTGTLLGTLNTGTGCGEDLGMAFDSSSNLYATAAFGSCFGSGKVVKFDNMGNLIGPFGSGYSASTESIVIDGSNNVYVGQPDGTKALKKFDSAGNFLTDYFPATEDRGTDWNDLAADQCTMYYTSEGSSVKRFNVCTNTQMSDFATGLAAPCYALRIRSNGEVIVTCQTQAYRLNSSGAVMQTYPIADGLLFAMNLDPDGTHFWTAGYYTHNVYKIDIATGSGTGAPVFTATTVGGNPVSGLAIFGEPTTTRQGLFASVNLDTNTCLNTVTFTLQPATADQFRISRDGIWEAQLPGNATSYTETTVADAPAGYNIYEIAALKSQHLVALTRVYVPNNTLCDLNPPSDAAPPADPITGSQNDLFVIIGGIGSKLPNNSLGALVNNGYGDDPGFLDFGDNTKVASYLMWHGYLDSRFIVFSYTGYTQDGMPNGFDCKYSYDGAHFFQVEVQRLSAQIQAAVANNPNVRVHILAHSQGGVIALSYVAALVKNIAGVAPLPQLKDVTLLDSPVGGTVYTNNYLTQMVLKMFSCGTASKFDDLKALHQLYATATDTSHRGQTASVVDAFLGGVSTDPSNTNQAVVDLAHKASITIFLAGNLQDYLWQPSGCIPQIKDFLSTQFIHDEGDSSGVYSRSFTSGIPTCIGSLTLLYLLNHLDVISNDKVNQAVLQVVQGKTPSALSAYTG